MTLWVFCDFVGFLCDFVGFFFVTLWVFYDFVGFVTPLWLALFQNLQETYGQS